jgi:hypothetical protein
LRRKRKNGCSQKAVGEREEDLGAEHDFWRVNFKMTEVTTKSLGKS